MTNKFFFSATNEEFGEIVDLISKILSWFDEMALGIQARHLIKAILAADEPEIKVGSVKTESIKLTAFRILSEMARITKRISGRDTYNRWMLISYLCRKSAQIGIERYFFVTVPTSEEKKYLMNHGTDSVSKAAELSLARVISDIRDELTGDGDTRLLPEEEQKLYSYLEPIMHDLDL